MVDFSLAVGDCGGVWSCAAQTQNGDREPDGTFAGYEEVVVAREGRRDITVVDIDSGGGRNGVPVSVFWRCGMQDDAEGGRQAVESQFGRGMLTSEGPHDARSSLVPIASLQRD